MEKDYFITSKILHRVLFALLKDSKIPYRLSLDLRITSSQMIRIIKLLKKEKFVEEEQIDKRTKLIKLNDKGKEFAIQIKKSYDLLKGGKT